MQASFEVVVVALVIYGVLTLVSVFMAYLLGTTALEQKVHILFVALVILLAEQYTKGA